jgi:ferredoxin-NADP reductase
MISAPLRLLTAEAPKEVAPYRDEIDQLLVCVGVEQETHDVLSFTLSAHELTGLRFDAGQYLTLTVEVDGEHLSRCYTIASAPTRPDSLTITVKRVEDGPVSNWLHDRVRPGTQLRVAGPFGKFSTARHPAAKYLFLSAGSGITPLMSMTRSAAELPQGSDIAFVHCARTPDDIIFRRELAQLHASNEGFRVVAVCEQDSAREVWHGPRGRLSLALLRDVVPDLGEREVFTCGPAPYMDAVRSILEQAGVDPSRCHEESFDFTTVTAVDPTPPVTYSETTDALGYSIELRRSGRTISCGPGSTVLGAAALAGMTLPSSCGEGICGTCKTTLISGNVDMDHQGGIRRREIDQNKILLCCSTPTTDLVIDA